MSDSSYIEVPVSAARQIAEQFQKDIVIVNAWDSVHELMHTTTYGVTAADKRWAALGGALSSEALGCNLAKVKSFSDFRDERIQLLESALTGLLKALEDDGLPGYLGDQSRMGVRPVRANG